jgi:anti-sigma B factor antagonist
MNSLTTTLRRKNLPGNFLELTLGLSGTLNKDTVSKFEHEIAPLIHERPLRLVVDICGADYISSHGLDALHKACGELIKNGGEFSLINTEARLETIRLETKDLDGVLAIKIVGHLDIRGVEAVEFRFQEFFLTDKPQILVDFSAADFLSSLGIRMIIKAFKDAKARGGRALILNPAAPVALALETAGLSQFIARGHDYEIAEGMRPI